MNFFGFFKLGVDTVKGNEQSLTNSNTPVIALTTPTFRVYGDSGFIESGTCTAFDSGTLTGTYEFSFTPTSPSYARGKMYRVVVSYTNSGGLRYGLHCFTLI